MNLLKRTLNISFIIVALFSLILSIYQIPAIKESLPWFDNQYQAWKYQRLADDFLPGTIQQKRYSAMSEAFKRGERDYKFEHGFLPAGK